VQIPWAYTCSSHARAFLCDPLWPLWFRTSNAEPQRTQRSTENHAAYTSRLLQALIKIYSLVDCPIYSVVKYRPHQLALICPASAGLNCCQSKVRRQTTLGGRIGPQLRIGGADRDRTGGLLVANQALSQLSYSPLNPAIGHWLLAFS
jgi:hypothetical protein